MAVPKFRTAALLATGEELVRGATADTNSAWIAPRLRAAGVTLAEIRIVGDALDAIRAAALELASRVDLLIVSGGLGPTPDDRTRDALAAAAGVALEEDAESARLLAAWFARLGRTPSASNARQALLPRGARAIPNSRGSAPGFELALGRALVIAVPGVPSELRAMFEESVLPRVRAGSGPPLAERLLQVVGLAESVLGERIAPWMAAPGPPTVSDAVKHGVITVCASDRDEAEGRARLDAAVAGMRAALGDHLFSERDETLAEHVVARLKARHATVAVAESCTGGLLAAALTDVPGSSEVFVEGAVTYVEAAKERSLGVPAALLRAHGAVSEAVARAMAAGVRTRAGATFGVATTGIAGPTGGSEATPVGLVHLAVAGADGGDHVARRYPGDRDSVRRFAVIGALDLLRRQLR